MKEIEVNVLRDQVQALSPREQDALRAICDANGLSIEDLGQSGNKEVNRIEMFLSNFPKIMCLHLFKHLRSLSIILQNVSVIENLESCTALEELWLCENRIERIENLSHLTKLKRLFLYSNKISRIEGLSGLQSLETLWLADNNISVLEGLECLPKLKELNVARNKILGVGDRLHGCFNLTSLNLADNKIGSFKEVCYLARLPALVDVCFSDPHWGGNPLAGLCNYQTYVLFMLPRLQSLDTVILSPETKQIARVTYMKKKMYYNMRIKTLKRNSMGILKRGGRGIDDSFAKSTHASILLQQVLKQAQRDLEELDYGLTEAVTHDQKEQLKTKVEALEKCLLKRRRREQMSKKKFEEAASQVSGFTTSFTRRLLIELETGGNIRLEEGKPDDLWFMSCSDLIASRFHAVELSAFGVVGIKVIRVTRIHNRNLRNTFEERMAACGEADMREKKERSSTLLEYLFCGVHPNLPGELQRTAEEGFRQPSDYAARGLDGAVVLSNSVNIADMPRLIDEGIQSRYEACNTWLRGQMLVSKVNLGKSQNDSVIVPGGCMNALDDMPRIHKRNFSEFDSVYRTKSTDPKQKMWYVFDPSMVLPEYLVEYEYELKGLTSSTAAAMVATDDLLKDLTPEMRVIATPMVPCLLPSADTPAGIMAKNAIEGEERKLDAECTAAMSMPPAISETPKITRIESENLTAIMSRGTSPLSISNLTYLNLNGSKIRKIEGLLGMVNLQSLVLSFNEILKIEGLSELVNLTHLDLESNLIRRIEGLKGLTKLTHINLHYNKVSRLEDLNVLKKYTPQVTHLDLRQNDVCESKSYRGLVLRRLTNLKQLDGSPVLQSEFTTAMETSSTLTSQLIHENAYVQRRTAWNLAPDGSGGPGRVLSTSSSKSMDWMNSVEEIVIENKCIRRLQNMDNMVSLKAASFKENEISRIEGLDNCVKLEELCLEGNRISQMEGLDNLHNIRKLDLGKNKISVIQHLGHLMNLMQLSIEDNLISSLSGLSQLHSLMELYIGNNNVRDLREVQQLKDLPKLIILDLLGNPLCTEKDSRHYIVYHLRKLKVLDGISIEPTEQAQAKSKYAGKLTLELLEERVGHRYFDHLRDMDLSQLKIRDLGGIFQEDDFGSLRELNLQNNCLLDISELGALSQLQALRLNGNRLESFNFGHAGSLNDKKISHHRIFPSLQILQLGSNSIRSISTLRLEIVKSLRSLFLQDNEIQKLDGLNGLSNLQELVLDRNRIKYIDTASLSGLDNLVELRLEENGLRSLSHISGLPSLRALHLGANRIVDMGEIDKLIQLPSLGELNLSGNPIGRKAVYRPIVLKKLQPLICLDGQSVTAEEREQAELMFVSQQERDSISSAESNLKHKIPIKLTSMNFDLLSIQGADPQSEQMQQATQVLNMNVRRESIAVSGRRKDAHAQHGLNFHGLIESTSNVVRDLRNNNNRRQSLPSSGRNNTGFRNF